MPMMFRRPSDFDRRPLDEQLRIFGEQIEPSSDGGLRFRELMIEAADELKLYRRQAEVGLR